jgi:hypothetical protein
MHQPLFIHKDPLLAGAYLSGDYAWNEAMRLEAATLVARPPASGYVRIALEVAGVVTEKQFTLVPSDLAEVRQSQVLGVKITAGQSVRWVVTEFAGEIATAASAVAVTVQVQRELDIVVPEQPLTVWWRDGSERLKLFSYDPTAELYTAHAPALAASRADLSDGVTFSITIRSVEVLRVASDTLYTNGLVAGGLVTPEQPQLQFYAGPSPLAVLTPTGVLHVPTAQQAATVAQVNQFRFGGAALNPGGLVAPTFSQPL